MTNEELQRAKEICEKATHGHWEWDRELGVFLRDHNGESYPIASEVRISDATFIAESRTLLPKALAEIERLRAALNKLDNIITNFDTLDGVREFGLKTTREALNGNP